MAIKNFSKPKNQKKFIDLNLVLKNRPHVNLLSILKKSHLIKLFSHYLYIGDWGDLARGTLCALDLREIIRSRAADQGSIP